MKNCLIIFGFIIIWINSSGQVNSKKNVFIDSVFNYLCESKVLHPEIVIKQAILETGWFNSKFLMNKNNIFAFRNKEYITFKSWRACVDYYKSWQTKHYKNIQEDYYHFLVRIKYAVPNYPEHIKKIKCDKSCN